MLVAGIEHCKFTNKEGKDVSFDRITLLDEILGSKGVGHSAIVVNCSPEKSNLLSVGEEVEVLYNRFGKVSRFEYVS